jgi:hypothetical protein
MALPPFPSKVGSVTDKIALDWFDQIKAAVDALSSAGGSGGSGGAPSTASYVTLATDASLSSERVLGASEGISVTDGGAGLDVTLSGQELKQRSWMGI